MDIYQLSLGGAVVDPRWLGASHSGRVPVEGNTVKLAGVALTVAGRRPAPGCPPEPGHRRGLAPVVLPDGALVEVWLDHSGHYVCASAQDFDKDLAEKAARAADLAQARALEQAKHAADAHEFNAALSVPVAWVPGHKDVLSGLSERSWGDGLNARSVVHVLLKEPLEEGRLRRQAGDFLCTSSAGTNGRRWSSQTEAPSTAKVSCTACLKLAQRWMAGGGRH